VSQPELLKTVVAELDAARIDYLLTGSLASSLQGDPRSTHDIDLVVAMDAANAERIVSAFHSSDFYLSASAVREAIQNRRMFNLLDLRDGGKVDFWLLTNEPFDRSRFARRIQASFEDVTVWVSSPEDTILAKLQWAELSGGSEKQFGDALGIFEVQRRSLDLAYLSEWVDKLSLAEMWAKLQNAAEPD
jgi:hypothetical protein